MAYHPKPTCPPLRLCVLARCSQVQLVQGDTLRGYRLADLEENLVEAPLGLSLQAKRNRSVGEAIRLIRDFVNTDAENPEAILLFTRRHGILEHQPNEWKFSYKLTDWTRQQGMFRSLWLLRMPGSPPIPWADRPFRLLEFSEGEGFEMKPEGLYYRTESLYRFMLLQLLSLPGDWLRICRGSRCLSFFVSAYHNQKYCGPTCFRDGLRTSKVNPRESSQAKSTPNL
jgi:hypothetical protein